MNVSNPSYRLNNKVFNILLSGHVLGANFSKIIEI